MRILTQFDFVGYLANSLHCIVLILSERHVRDTLDYNRPPMPIQLARNPASSPDRYRIAVMPSPLPTPQLI